MYSLRRRRGYGQPFPSFTRADMARSGDSCGNSERNASRARLCAEADFGVALFVLAISFCSASCIGVTRNGRSVPVRSVCAGKTSNCRSTLDLSDQEGAPTQSGRPRKLPDAARGFSSAASRKPVSGANWNNRGSRTFCAAKRRLADPPSTP